MRVSKTYFDVGFYSAKNIVGESTHEAFIEFLDLLKTKNIDCMSEIDATKLLLLLDDLTLQEVKRFFPEFLETQPAKRISKN